MLFICAGVILLTLVIASVLLPLLTREKHVDSSAVIDRERSTASYAPSGYTYRAGRNDG